MNDTRERTVLYMTIQIGVKSILRKKDVKVSDADCHYL